MPRSQPSIDSVAPAASALDIWLVNPFDDLPGEGIPPLRYWTLARVLTARGHHVTWWTATWSHRRKATRSAATEMATHGDFDLRLVPVRPYQKNVSVARLASHADFGRHVEEQATAAVATGDLARPALILASLPPFEGPEAAMRLAKRFDATFILDAQDLWPETFERLLPGPAFFRRAVGALLLRRMRARRERLVAAADGLVAVTAAHADQAFARGPQQTPRHVCYVGADLSAFPSPPAAAVDASPEAEIQCVYAGSLEAGQDVAVLHEAARLLSARNVRATLHIAGDGSLLGRLRNAAAHSTGTCRLVVHGLLEAQSYRNLLAASHVGLICVKPDTHVVVPNKACDYAAAGLALVNSLPGELAALIKQYGAGLPYVCGNAASLADTIADIARDRDRLSAKQRGSRLLAEEKLDRQKTYPQFANWIEATASRRTGTSNGPG